VARAMAKPTASKRKPINGMEVINAKNFFISET
jgi:hypothetical protein